MKHIFTSFLLAAAMLTQQASTQTLFSDPAASVELPGTITQLLADAEMTTLTVVVPSVQSFRTTLELPISGALGKGKNTSLHRPALGLIYIPAPENQMFKPLAGVGIGPSVLSWRAAGSVHYQRSLFQFGVRGSYNEMEGRFIHAETRAEGLLVMMMTASSSVEILTLAPKNQQATYSVMLAYKLSSTSNVSVGFIFPPDGYTNRSIAFNVIF